MALLAPTQDRSLGVDELRHEGLRAIVAALLAMAIAVLWLVALEPNRWQLEPAPVVVLLVASAAATGWLLPRGIVPATTALLLGLGATITTALYAFGNDVYATAYPIGVLIAGMLLGWRYALGVGAATAAVVFALCQLSPEILSTETAELALLLTAVNFVLSWLLSRPTRAALDWAWASYTQAVEKTEEARLRQAELARLSKSLEETCFRLEAANEELERARKAAVEARRLKAEFASTVSHELRTPLNLIVGFSEMMINARRTYGQVELPDAFRGDVEAIYRNACHLSTLIDDVLDLSQVEAHRLGFRREPSDLREIVREALGSVESVLRDRGLDIAVDLPPDLPTLNVDRTRIRQVLVNLVVNAARFTFEGGIQVSASVRDADLVVTVADTGVGIPPSELEDVFREFHQIGSSDRRHHSGLGLAICKRLVELHGGAIWAESVVGQGSKLSFSLPTCENVVAVLPDTWETWARADGKGQPAVLVLGEDEGAVRLFERFVERFQVLDARDAVQAERLARQAEVKALIAVGAPGEAEVARVRETSSALGRLPTLRCSLRTVSAIGRDLGVAEYLTKPVTRERLRSALRRLSSVPRNVLVVDDDPEMVRLLTRMVRAEARRCRVRGADGGIDGLAAMRAEPPDLVLLDLLMPDVDGYAILTAMREDERLRAVPVVVISARGVEEETVTAQDLRITQDGGLAVGDLIECLQASLDVLAGATRPVPPRRADSAG